MEKRNYSREENKIKINMLVRIFLSFLIIAIMYIFFIIYTKNVILNVGILLIIIPISYLIYKIAKVVKEANLNVLYLEKYLSKEHKPIHIIDYKEFKKDILRLANTYVEILPVEDAEEYIKDIKKLLISTKFFARISENNEEIIEIFVQYNNDIKLYYYETISIYKFNEKYSI